MLGSKLPLFSYGRDGHRPFCRGLYTHFQDFLLKWDDHPKWYGEFRPQHISLPYWSCGTSAAVFFPKRSFFLFDAAVWKGWKEIVYLNTGSKHLRYRRFPNNNNLSYRRFQQQTTSSAIEDSNNKHFKWLDFNHIATSVFRHRSWHWICWSDWLPCCIGFLWSQFLGSWKGTRELKRSNEMKNMIRCRIQI